MTVATLFALFSFTASAGTPTAAQLVLDDGRCLAATQGSLQLAPCADDYAQQWIRNEDGTLQSAAELLLQGADRCLVADGEGGFFLGACDIPEAGFVVLTWGDGMQTLYSSVGATPLNSDASFDADSGCVGAECADS